MDPLRHGEALPAGVVMATPPDDAAPPLSRHNTDSTRRSSLRLPNHGTLEPLHSHGEPPHPHISKRRPNGTGAKDSDGDPPLNLPKKARLDWAHSQLLHGGWDSLGSLGGRLRLGKRDFTDDKRFRVSTPDEHGQRTLALTDESNRPRRTKGTGRTKPEHSASPGRSLRWQPKL